MALKLGSVVCCRAFLTEFLDSFLGYKIFVTWSPYSLDFLGEFSKMCEESVRVFLVINEAKESVPEPTLGVSPKVHGGNWFNHVSTLFRSP